MPYPVRFSDRILDAQEALRRRYGPSGAGGARRRAWAGSAQMLRRARCPGLAWLWTLNVVLFVRIRLWRIMPRGAFAGTGKEKPCLT